MSTITTTSTISSSINKVINDNEQNNNELVSLSSHSKYDDGFRERFNQNMDNKFALQSTINKRAANPNKTNAKGLTYYIMNPSDLREDYPVWHYFYLCTLIFGAFITLFIVPVVFGMLAAIGGIGTPLVLSIVGSFFGLFLGAVFGVVFAVVCIIFLMKSLGFAAEWILDVLSNGGNDLVEITKEQFIQFVNNSPSQ
ncbi:18130_t:CDS:2 [Entrophospora sp. SA101]|nr:12100_t:CDS:2 [Entrophospora sp. SA101]CAJ0639214.1 9874_t:CDS:2 [Entrophospora sp. SA101]CAJ0752124.1 6576_t:CDS:2 [Entrophospora sp. SA101]CAJ0756641.1 18130_t:CDS:2 [Entrophospora sp. SA101]CAJ0836375.1 8798_t:CDS:2 [Entrophospora sp. SA101]